MTKDFIKIEMDQFRLAYDVESPPRALSGEVGDFTDADLENYPDLAEKQGKPVPYDDDQMFEALQILMKDVNYQEHQHDWYGSDIGVGRDGKPCSTTGSVLFWCREMDEQSAAREVKLVLQRWASACRVVGGLDGILAEPNLRKRLNELGEIMGARWGTHDAYMANHEHILKEYNAKGYRHPVWVNGLIFEEALARLDFYLTGKTAGKPTDANWSYPKHPEDCMSSPGNLIYLSDGGYSRVVVHQVEEDGQEMFHLDLASESRDEVKAKFHEQLRYIAQIEYAMNEWLETAMKENA